MVTSRKNSVYSPFPGSWGKKDGLYVERYGIKIFTIHQYWVLIIFNYFAVEAKLSVGFEIRNVSSLYSKIENNFRRKMYLYSVLLKSFCLLLLLLLLMLLLMMIKFVWSELKTSELDTFNPDCLIWISKVDTILISFLTRSFSFFFSPCQFPTNKSSRISWRAKFQISDWLFWFPKNSNRLVELYTLLLIQI